MDPKTGRDDAPENVRKQEEQIRSPEFARTLRAGLEIERAATAAGTGTSNRESLAMYPLNPEAIFAHRLREFLDETADANFSARTIHLTGGPDGIEFVDPADRKRSTTWQMAVIAGPRGDRRGASCGPGVAEGDRAVRAINRRQALALAALPSPPALARRFGPDRSTAWR